MLLAFLVHRATAPGSFEMRYSERTVTTISSHLASTADCRLSFYSCHTIPSLDISFSFPFFFFLSLHVQVDSLLSSPFLFLVYDQASSDLL